MPNKTGLCKHCADRNELKRSCFDVDLDLETIHCPRCGRKIKTYDAVDNFDKEIERLLLKASYTLYVKCDPQKAYELTGEVISLDPENVVPYFGRILCLMYSSKMHKSYINEAIAIIENETVNRFHKLKDKDGYSKFILKVGYVIDEYLARIRKNVVLKQCFYDTECLSLYYQHVAEVLSLEKILLDEAEFCIRHNGGVKAEKASNFLRHDILEKQNILSSPYRTVDGRQFVFEHLKRSGEAVIKEYGLPVDTHLSKYRLATFDVTNKNLRHINEIVFKNYTGRITFYNLSFIGVIIFALCGVVLTTAAFMSNQTEMIKNIFLGFGITGFAIALLLAGFFIQGIIYFKKRKKRMN